ncbi:MAG TPA: hypothetical protein VFW44_18170 [Bryobacteraceae bacterium]|nr:hypothetical protein [Bryobacteraceae bacterium]
MFSTSCISRIQIRVGVVAAMLLLGAACAFAQRPDWTGYYTLASARDLAGSGYKQDSPGEQLNNLIIPHLQPWAKARMEATDGIADDTGQVCLPDGIFRYPSMAGRFVWIEEPGRIIMAFQEVNTAGIRHIYLDRAHPKDPVASWNGHSIGHWQGDTLLVDTVGFNDKSWLFGGMEPHTEEARLIERMRQVKGQGGSPVFLEINITVEDQHALTSAYSYNRYYKKQPDGAEMPESVCNEDPVTWKRYRNEALKKQVERSHEVR